MQRSTDAPNGVNDPFPYFTPRKIWLRMLDHIAPKLVADAVVQQPVAYDCEPVRLRRDQNQRRIFIAVPVQADPLELSLRTLKRIHFRIGDHAHADASGRPIFGVGQGTRYGGAFVARHGLKFTAGAVCAQGCD
jgi:hypothetical protein